MSLKHELAQGIFFSVNYRIVTTLIGAFLLAGCGKQAAPPVVAAPAAPANPTVRDLIPNQAQPKLRTIKLWLGAEEMNAELAATPSQIVAGMMYRTNIEPNAGMLFLLPKPAHPAFWMKNCPLDLSAAFMDPEGIVLELHDFQAESTNPVAATAYDVQYVLETSRGWFAQHNISTGMLVRTEYGTFSNTFYRKTPTR